MKVFLLTLVIVYVQGHGYLEDPPGRSSAWKFGFKTPANYDHMALFCGGAEVYHGRNGGKCGVCGDDYSSSRSNEPGPGNKYATATIVKSYQSGAVIDIKIHLTAYHKGYFEFKLCDNDVPQKGKDASIRVQQSCFDKHLLTNADGSSTQFIATPQHSSHNVKLPDGVKCTNCVLQWRYITGNRWGCAGGACATGLGPQEEFWGCADVAILGGPSPVEDFGIVITTPEPIYTTRKPVYTTSKPVYTTSEHIYTTRKPVYTTTKPVFMTGRPAGRLSCHGVTPWSHLSDWCNKMCNLEAAQRYCPITHCSCQGDLGIVNTTPESINTTGKPVVMTGRPAGRLSCRGIAPWSHLSDWCNKMCNLEAAQRYCPITHCSCQGDLGIVNTTPEQIYTTRKPVVMTGRPAGRLSCRGIAPWSHLSDWCNTMCNLEAHQRHCPSTQCACQ